MTQSADGNARRVATIPDRFFNLDAADRAAKEIGGGLPRVRIVAGGGGLYLVAVGEDPVIERRPGRLYDPLTDRLYPAPGETGGPLRVDSFTAQMGEGLRPVSLPDEEIAALEARIVALLEAESR